MKEATVCRKSRATAVVALAVLALFAADAMGTILVNENFDRGGTLNGSTPQPGPGGVWVEHSGTAGQIQMVGGAIQLKHTTQSEDLSTSWVPALGAGGKVYAAFDLINTGGNTTVYFAHFLRTGTNNFSTRVFITSIQGGDYTLGIGDGSTPAQTLTTPMEYGTSYRVVVSYAYDSRLCELWIDPASETAPDISFTSTYASNAVNAYAFREASGNSIQTIDNLVVATTFNEALAGVASSGPTGSGSASPTAVRGGESVLLTVNVTPGADPPSTGIAVTADLTAIGGSAAQAFTDAGNGTFTWSGTVGCVLAGLKSLPVTITDLESRTGSTSISLTVSELFAAQPQNAAVCDGSTAVFNVAANGSNLTYQWYNASGPLTDLANKIVGATTATLRIMQVDSNDAANGPYRVVVTDACGTTSSNSCTLTISAGPSGPSVVISQVYGAGGNSGALYKNDFIELHNRSGTPVDLSTWSVQYASSTGSSWSNKTDLTGSIPANGYYLIQESQGTGGTLDLPTPDVTGSIAMGASAGKVALVSHQTPLTGSCPIEGVVDFVGYGSAASCYEGSGPTGTLNSTTAAIRKDGGCQDLQDNAGDFDLSAPAPRNSGSPTQECPSQPPSGNGSANPATVALGGTVELTVVVTPGANGCISSVVADLTSIGGLGSQALTDFGNNVYTLTCVVPCTGVSAENKSLPVTITDAGSATGSATIALNVISATAIDKEPQDAVVCSGGTAVFAVSAHGSNLTYQWYDKNGPLANGGDISGATSAVLRIAAVDAADVANAPYHVKISGECIDTTSRDCALTINSGPASDDFNVVISQVYGGGGNSGAYYKNDFIELFNKGDTAVSLDGWSVQYASSDTYGSAPAFDDPPRYTLLSGTIEPHSYYLIAEAAGANPEAVDLPWPNVTGDINIGSGGGKIALVKSTSPLAGTCPTDCVIVDFVGWGDGVGCFRGTGNAPGTSNTSSIVRRNACTGGSDNAADWVLSTFIIPHDMAYDPFPVIWRQPENQSPCLGGSATFFAGFNGACNQYQWMVLDGGWQPIPGATDSTYPIPAVGPEHDGKQYLCRVTPAWDAGYIVDTFPATLSVVDATAHDKQVVISEIYPAGGLSGAIYQNDYIELYNQGTSAVVMDGWSVQYASSTGSSWQVIEIPQVSLVPGQRLLIQAGQDKGCDGSPCGDALLQVDAVGNINMSGTAGKVALVKTVDVLPTGTSCPVIGESACKIVDFVGYGSANCFEGTGPAPSPANRAQSVQRPSCGGVEANDNAADFISGEPSPEPYGPVYVAADFDRDGKVNGTEGEIATADYAIFLGCAGGPDMPYAVGCTLPPVCGDKIAADFDRDGDVDADDFGVFQRCYSWNDAALPGCDRP